MSLLQTARKETLECLRLDGRADASGLRGFQTPVYGWNLGRDGVEAYSMGYLELAFEPANQLAGFSRAEALAWIESKIAGMVERQIRYAPSNVPAWAKETRK